VRGWTQMCTVGAGFDGEAMNAAILWGIACRSAFKATSEKASIVFDEVFLRVPKVGSCISGLLMLPAGQFHRGGSLRSDSVKLPELAPPEDFCEWAGVCRRWYFEIGIITLAGIICLMPESLPAVEIIAHRGASYDAPENTVASAKLGWEQKADAVEIDIHAAPAGLIVIHDETTNRTTNRRGPVATLTEEERLACDAGSWKGRKFVGEKLPKLEDILAAQPKNGRLVIEIKAAAALALLPEVVRKSGLDPGQFIIIAFDPNVAAGAKKALPSCKVLRLASYEPRQASHQIDYLIELSKSAGLDGLNLSRKWPIDAAFVKKVHDAGLSLYVWTVDDADLARKLRDVGVDGITTNRPGWLRERLAE
jgi:glycerophosphoryl diester phosphodiesterase